MGKILVQPSNIPSAIVFSAVSSWRSDCDKELASHWAGTDKVARKGVKFHDGIYARAHDWDARLTYNGRRRGNINGRF